MLGAQGTGKGTVAGLISEKTGLPQISTGDIFRKNISEKTPLGVEADKYISKGNLVPDDITVPMVEDRLTWDDAKNGVILDGFPRTIEQAEKLDKILAKKGEKIDLVINLVTPKEEIIDRMLTRRVCTNQDCKATYNIKLHRLSNNTEIKEILVNDEKVDLSTFEHIVKNVNSVDVKVTTADEKAKVSIDSGTENVNTVTATIATQLTTVRTIKVTAPDGTVKEYSLTLIKKTTITGKVFDANIVGEHYATITVYQTDDTRIEGDIKDPREVISSVQTNADGTYEVILEPGKYDIVFNKPGYLSYRITGIDIKDGLGAVLDDIELLGGDVDGSGEIELDDLVAINDNYCSITDDNKAEKECFDLNGDKIVNSLDRAILKKNYHTKATVIQWVDPDVVTTNNEIATNSLNEEIAVESQNANENGFILPMNCDYRISSAYGYRVHPISGVEKLHSGLDIVGTWHTPILAVADGEITYAGTQNGLGILAVCSIWAMIAAINCWLPGRKWGGPVEQSAIRRHPFAVGKPMCPEIRRSRCRPRPPPPGDPHRCRG